MKVRVSVRVSAGQQEKEAHALASPRALDVVLGPGETAANLKERIAEIEPLPFPDQSLVMNGQVIADEQLLADCGVEERGALDLVVQASTDIFVSQLSLLLKARDLSSDELGLLYSYKYGASIGQALKILGFDGKLQEFLRNQKPAGIQVNNNIVALVRDNTALKPFSVVEEVELILRNSSGAMEIKELCTRFANRFGVTLASVANARPVEFLAKEKALFTVPRPGYVALKGAHGKYKRAPGLTQQMPPADGSDEGQRPVLSADAPEYIPDSPPGLGGPPGLGAGVAADWNVSAELAPVPTQQICKWFLKGECWAGAKCKNSHDVQEAMASQVEGQQEYTELHDRICDAVACSRTAEAIDEVVRVLQEVTFLNVDRVVRGDSFAKDTAISTTTETEAVFFLRAFPVEGHDRWMPPLLKAAAGVLAERVEGEHGIEGVHATEDSVRLRVPAPNGAPGHAAVVVDLRFSPLFGNYADILKALAAAPSAEARRLLSASLVGERVQFVSRQPGSVKKTIRLLKWWRDQRDWLGERSRPTDEILELVVVYSAAQTKPLDQRRAVANVMSLLSRFGELRIVWSSYYSKGDVWEPLLWQRPLLVDPVNPYVNLADPQAFDPRELVAAAATTHFFF